MPPQKRGARPVSLVSLGFGVRHDVPITVHPRVLREGLFSGAGAPGSFSSLDLARREDYAFTPFAVPFLPHAACGGAPILGTTAAYGFPGSTCERPSPKPQGLLLPSPSLMPGKILHLIGPIHHQGRLGSLTE